MQDRKRDQSNIDGCVPAEESFGYDKSHDPRRAEAPDAKCNQGAGEEVSGNLLRLVREFLNILNEVTLLPHLPTYVQELRHNCHQKMRMPQELTKTPGEEKTIPLRGSSRGIISGMSYQGPIRLKAYDTDLVESLPSPGK